MKHLAWVWVTAGLLGACGGGKVVGNASGEAELGVDETELPPAALSSCAPRAETSGVTHGLPWAQLQQPSQAQLSEACQQLCTTSARCSGYAEQPCRLECEHVLSQASEQHCEQSLLTAMRCLSRNQCQAGLPDTASQDDIAPHICNLEARAVSCSLRPGSTEGTIFELFRGDDLAGLGLVASQGAAYGARPCSVKFMNAPSLYELEMECVRADGGDWCCTCSDDHQPVRAFVAQGDTCPLGDSDSPERARASAACGWRY